MRLITFKKKLKLAIFVGLLVAYGLASYQVGKMGFGNFISQKLTPKPKPTQKSIEQPLPYTDSQSGSVISSFVKVCANTVFGFEMSYPKDWFTTYASDEERCTFFAPFAFVITGKTNDNLIPIKVEVVEIDQWTAITKFYENPNDFQNIVSIQNLKVGDKFVEKIKATSTGAGLTPAGYQRISYLVFNPQTSLVFNYQQLAEKDEVAVYEKVLEEMVTSLRYF